MCASHYKESVAAEATSGAADTSAAESAAAAVAEVVAMAGMAEAEATSV